MKVKQLLMGLVMGASVLVLSYHAFGEVLAHYHGHAVEKGFISVPELTGLSEQPKQSLRVKMSLSVSR